MGCFNVSCGASGISMYADEAVLIPLRRVPGLEVDGTNLVSNEGSQSLFVPITLPIFGTLNTYGCFEEIQEDANTKAIEAFYKTDIETFTKKIAYGQEHAGMYVHREIYDTLAKKQFTEFGEPAYYCWDEGYLTDDILTLAGFELVKADEAPVQRYYKQWKHAAFPGLDLWSDGNYVGSVQVGNKKTEHPGYHMKALAETIKQLTNKAFPAEIKKQLKSTPFAAVLFDGKRKALDNLTTQERLSAKHEKGEPITDEELQQVINNTIALTRMILRGPDGFSLGRGGTTSFRSLYADCLDGIRQNFVDWYNFDKALFAINRLYMPTFNGYQHGNHHMSKVLYQKSLSIIKAKLTEGEEDDDDD